MGKGIHEMIRRAFAAICALAMTVVLIQNGDAAADPPTVAVVVGPQAANLERFAADQLCDYLAKLYGLKVQPGTEWTGDADVGLLVGTPASNPVAARAVGEGGWPQLTDQGLVLKRAALDEKAVLVIGGGSPQATMWAVYELVERWGVRYLLHGDVLPRKPGAFRLPEDDLLLEPNLRIRQWRVVNAHAFGPESWGMADYRPVLDQLAKLKFNRILIGTWPYQPFLDFEAGGIRRKSAWLFFGEHYPITDDMPGRSLFGNEPEFWNPDLPCGESYEKLAAAGEQLLHRLMEYARERGMQSVMAVTPTEYPPEFAPLLEDSRPVHQLGGLTIVPGPSINTADPRVTELASAVLQATVNTYPEVDFVSLGMPEFRDWAGQYEKAWQTLDRKYDLATIRPLAEMLAAAENRVGYSDSPARAVAEVKGDLVALSFYDRLLTELRVLEGTRRPDMKFVYYQIAEELYPLLRRLLPPGSETLNFIDYCPSVILKRKEVLGTLPVNEVPSTLIYTLHDDNVGVLPQLATGSLHELTLELRRYGWTGFSTRYWLIGDHDPCVAYLARAAWHADATPEAVYRDQIESVCGPRSMECMMGVFREVEAVSAALAEHGPSLTFPVPGMMMKHWAPGGMPTDLVADRSAYQRALDMARGALIETEANGKPYIDYWIGRLEFAVKYFDAIEAVHRAATAEAAGDRAETVRQAENALNSVTDALEAYARVARDQSDRGALAMMAEYVYRPLRDKFAALQREE